jgi:hypothetical protein
MLTNGSAVAKYEEVSSEQLFNVQPLSSGLSTITFSGNLPLGWAGSLAQGLSENNINILSGHAKRIRMSIWEGELVVNPVYSSADMRDIDFASLLNKKNRGVSPAAITSFVVRECFRANGSMYVEINGHDQRGFLAAVLKRFASCGLYPWDFSVLTKDDVIFDKFHLMGPAGVPASRATMMFLEQKLRDWVV